MSRLRVVITAYTCEPGRGGEHAVGWHAVRQAALRHDVWCVTRENNVAAIERAARAEGLERLRVVGHDLPAWARGWKRGGRGAALYTWLWQHSVRGTLRRLHAEHAFDLAHHSTMVGSWTHAGLRVLDVPFVLGPVGHHGRVPDRFLRRGDLRGRAAELLRAGTKEAFLRLDPALHATWRAADLVLSVSRVFGDRAPAWVRPKLRPLPAIGVDAPELPRGRFARSAGFEVLYAGRLVDLKGPRLALAAFARLASAAPEARLAFLGDGPLRGPLEREARRLGLEDRVRVLGPRGHDETRARMRAADVFLFPSFEGAGMVVPEAMAEGACVLCLDTGGPREMVADGRGLAVPVGRSFAATVQALAGGLSRLHRDEPLRARLARAGHAWVARELTWDAKGERLEALYREALDLARASDAAPDRRAA